MDTTLLLKWLIPASGVLALLYAFTRTRWVNKQDMGTDQMIDLSKNIAEGARTFLNREYRWLSIFRRAVKAV